MTVQLPELWTAAVIVLGFQLTAFTWRLSREVAVRAGGGVNWLPPSDMLYLVSMIIMVVGVFIIPILGVADLNLINRLFGLSMLLFAGYPFALSGHYGLFTAMGRRQVGYFPFQEMVVIAIVIFVAATYLILAFFIK